MKENLFDLSKTDDLPEKIKEKLRRIPVRKDAKKLLDLFKIKQTLSIDEIIVGLYRQYKMEKSRTWIHSTLYNLSRKEILKKVEGTKGVYKNNLQVAG